MKDEKNVLYIIINKILKEFSFNKILHKSSLFSYLTLFIFIINFKDINPYQEINITINGTGTQPIVNKTYFKNKPNVTLVNGILQNNADYYVYNLIQDINIITMRWYNKLKSCYYMFYNLKNIIGFDFSNFDTSEVTDMQWMFKNVNSLKVLDLSNFNTSSVKYMISMFYGCTSLMSLDLSNFNTSQVTDFSYMFYGCNSLIYLNLNSFIIQGSADIDYMLNRTSENLLLCYNTSKTSKLNGHSNSCDNNCFKNETKLIIDKKACTDECDNNIYKYEYKNICFKSCSEISEYFYGISNCEIYYNYNKTNKDEITDDYYLLLDNIQFQYYMININHLYYFHYCMFCI